MVFEFLDATAKAFHAKFGGPFDRNDAPGESARARWLLKLDYASDGKRGAGSGGGEFSFRLVSPRTDKEIDEACRGEAVDISYYKNGVHFSTSELGPASRAASDARCAAMEAQAELAEKVG